MQEAKVIRVADSLQNKFLSQVSEVDKLHEWMAQTQQLLEEADDHVRWLFHTSPFILPARFLGTIESSLDVIATTNDFDQVIKKPANLFWFVLRRFLRQFRT